MHVSQRIATLAVAFATIGYSPVAAQIDYRNLDDHRPVRTEDAYPVERYAFELLLPYEYENGPAGERHHVATPELAYGAFANTQLGLKLPFGAREARGGDEWGIGGPRLFALHNLNTEGPSLPAFAVRADLTLPLGDLGADATQLTLKGIATRGWGRTRLHLNAGATLGDEDERPALAAEPRWIVSLAADRTYLRQSLLLVGELAVLEEASDAPTDVTAGVGLRYQLTPTLVLDAGVSRRLTADAGPDVGLTLGLSHAFAIAGLLPGGPR